MNHVVPYANVTESKKDQVTQMFNNIAVRYDALNTFFTMGIDNNWRTKVIDKLAPHNPQRILDIATGTGVLAIRLTELQPKEILGVDLSQEMLNQGVDKVRKKGLDHIIALKRGDGENLPTHNNYFDAATIAFGIRNFENPLQGLKEVYRSLKPGGVLTILELSRPEKFPMKQLHQLYSNYLMPFCARAVSNDRKAYRYLPESINAFVCRVDMTTLFKEAGFEHTELETLTYGTATIYTGIKPK